MVVENMKTTYPNDYSDEDKAIYDDLFERGSRMIGKKINKSDSFLIDLAIKATIFQMKGNKPQFTQEEIDEMKLLHQDFMKQGLIVETPSDIFYDGLLKNSETNEIYPHPLSKTEEEYYEDNLVENTEQLIIE